MAPVAVTPDDLGENWRDARVHLPRHVWWNGELFGHQIADRRGLCADIPEMFAE